MTHEEKVCFLFDQTLQAVLNHRGQGAVPSDLAHDFDRFYKALEEQLDKKLKEK